MKHSTNTVETAQTFAATLIESDPEGALRLFYALGGAMPAAAFPVLTECTVIDDGETFAGVRCPHCRTLLSDDGLAVVDWGTRWTYSDDVSADERYHSMNYDDPTEVETLHYMCSSCTRPVSLPEGWTEEN